MLDNMRGAVWIGRVRTSPSGDKHVCCRQQPKGKLNAEDVTMQQDEKRLQEDIVSVALDIASRIPDHHPPVILTGPPGCGKTHVLKALINMLGDKMNSAVHYFDCAGASPTPLHADAIVGHLLRKFTPGGDLQQLFGLVQRILPTFLAANSIVALDDVHNGDIIADVATMLPHSCHLIATCVSDENLPITALVIPVPILREHSLESVCCDVVSTACERLSENEAIAVAIAAATNPHASLLLARTLNAFPGLEVSKLLDALLDDVEAVSDDSPVDMLEKCFANCYYFLSEPAQELLVVFSVFPGIVDAATVDSVLGISSATVCRHNCCDDVNNGCMYLFFSFINTMIFKFVS